MRLIIALFVFCICALNANAQVIKMIHSDKYGFKLPQYIESDVKGGGQAFNIGVIADREYFPFSSEEQGSVFYKIFQDLAQTKAINILFYYPKDYQEEIQKFERNKNEQYENAIFGVYYEEVPYSHNKFIYPAFFENKFHIITSMQNKLDLQNKEELKTYKGIYVATDKISKVVEKEFSILNMKKVENYEKAYEMLLTEKADYIAASYYPSQIKAYMLGIRDYIVYSKGAVWKMPMFLRVKPEIKNNPRIADLEKYFQSARYKKIRDNAFQELIEIYRENTQGVVPPTYINQNNNNEMQSEEEQENAVSIKEE